MQTVNVITTDETGSVQAINAFPDTDEGNRDAEAVFKEKLNSVLVLDVFDDDAEALVEDGFAMNGAGETCQLVHSIERMEE